MPGMGLDPAGGFGAGWYTPAQAAAPLPATDSAVRLVDPLTGDYSRNADGTFAQVTPLEQRVLWALRTKLGTSSELRDGGISAPGKVSETFESEATHAVQQALAPLGSDVTLVGVSVDRSTSPPRLTITFSDPNGDLQTVTP